ncbi:MAG: flippase-like domain-containing protein [Clostridia bacterium]|nr:flippase-like domain-containing protein [Clostridia bacterium]
MDLKDEKKIKRVLKSNKKSKKTENEFIQSDLVSENLEKSIKIKKQKPTANIIKRRVFVRNKLLRFKSSYCANIAHETKFYVSYKTEFIASHQNKKYSDFLQTANEGLKQTKKKKKLSFIYYILNIVIIGVVLAIQLSQESNPMEAISAISNVNWWFVFAALGTFAIGMILDAVRYATLIKKATGVFRFSLGYKVGAMGRYYDTITPLSTGGQPFQVIYTNKYGIKPGDGISIAMGRYIFYQIVYFIMVTIFVFKLVFSADSAIGMVTEGSVAEGFVTTLMWIGYAIMAVVIITVLFMSLNKRAGAGFVIGILKLLSKIHFGKFRIIKNYKKTFGKVMRTVNLWQTTTRKYCKSFWVIFVNFVGSILFFLITYSMPFFVYCAFEGWPVDFVQTWSTIISFAVIVDLTSAFNPIPMGAGTADISFAVLYGSLFSIPGASVWALLIWRFFCNYIYILQGLVVVNYDFFIGNKRLEKYKEYWCLPRKKRKEFKAGLMLAGKDIDQ